MVKTDQMCCFLALSDPSPHCWQCDTSQNSWQWDSMHERVNFFILNFSNGQSQGHVFEI